MFRHYGFNVPCLAPLHYTTLHCPLLYFTLLSFYFVLVYVTCDETICARACVLFRFANSCSSCFELSWSFD